MFLVVQRTDPICLDSDLIGSRPDPWGPDLNSVIQKSKDPDPDVNFGSGSDTFKKIKNRVCVLLRGYGAMCNMYVYWHGE